MSRAERRSHERAAPAKGSRWWIWALVIVVILVAGGIWLAHANAPRIDFSQYNYTDELYTHPNATHTLEEFSDFQCPVCQAEAPSVQAYRDLQDPSVQVVYKFFPLRSIHPFAEQAAEAAACAKQQDRFWAYHDVLFDTKQLDTASLRRDAEGLGLDMVKWQTCIDSGEGAKLVQADYVEGTQRGVEGTPTFFADGTMINARSVLEFEAAFASNATQG